MDVTCISHRVFVCLIFEMLVEFIVVLEISSIITNVGSKTPNTRLYHLYMHGSCIQIYVIQDDRASDSNVSLV